MSFSTRIDFIAHQCKGRREMTVKELLDLGGDAVPLLVAGVLSIPFVLLIPIPGLAALFGAIICLLGIRMALHKSFWLPKKWKGKTFSGDTLARRLEKWVPRLRKFDKYVHPRGTVYQHHPMLQTFNGWGLAVCGFLLLLPPGTNFFPALGTLLLSVGLLQKDIVLMIVAYLALAINLALFLR